MIQQASQAPYGKGEETIVDTDVRRVWQLDPKQFSVRNSQWDACLAKAVAKVQEDFALSEPVKSDLYKLLIYETPDSDECEKKETE